MLVFNNVSKSYGKRTGIRNVSFSLQAGEIMAVLGANGSGKTTTFRLLLGLIAPDAGEIIAAAEAQRKFGYLPEERSLLKEHVVYRQVAFFAKLKKMKDEEIEIAYQKWENILKIKEYRYKRIRELSKGNQQKVQLLCCLIHNPQIVILDEPFTGLDQENVLLLQRVIQQLKIEKKIILLSSHQHQHIEDLCDKLLLLQQGEARYFGSIKELKQQYHSAYLTLDSSDYIMGGSPKIQERQQAGNKIMLALNDKEFARRYAAYKLCEEKVAYLKFEEGNLAEIIREIS